MYLNFSPPLAAKITGSGLKHSLSAVLTGMTAVGTCSAIAFNLDKANSIGKALEPIKNTYVFNLFSKGILNLNNTFKDWGGSIFNSKDAFIDWLSRYFDVNGLKSGVAALYEKLHNWAEIVYRWFRDKFLVFISHIPQMVKDWKKLRLSLFKWGTFLGGGGGSALWAMFGSGDNWGRLAELMGDPEFAETLGTISELMAENSDTFSSMSQEDVQTIMEKILDDHKEANEIAKGLLKEQKEENKDKEESEKTQIEAQKISESFSKQKGGKPEDIKQALSNMIGAGLNGILTKKRAGSFRDSWDIAKKAMEEHIELLRKESKGVSKFAKVKKEFLETIETSKDQLISAFARLSERAYNMSGGSDSIEIKQLATIFGTLMNEEFTEEAGEGQEGDADLSEIVKSIESK